VLSHQENILSSSHSLEYLTQSRATAARSSIKIEPIHGGLFVLFGTGGNIAVLSRGESLLLVDAGWSTEEAEISEALSQLSKREPSHLINTHWHYDHTDGNAWVQARGATITAHRNTRMRLAEAQYNDVLDAVLPASPANGLPTELFEGEHRLKVEEVNVAMKPYQPAHTDGDIRVHFEEFDILHVGDTWSNGFYPFIDASSGGHIDGMIQATEANLRLASESTVIIPGHGPVGNREQLRRSLCMLQGVREVIATWKQQGRTLAEVIEAQPTSPYAPHFSGSFVPVELFVGCVYRGV
jgi:glyoxylase-like metal-dependent hydrolase (beta-lactamase superfamily II)